MRFTIIFIELFIFSCNKNIKNDKPKNENFKYLNDSIAALVDSFGIKIYYWIDNEALLILLIDTGFVVSGITAMFSSPSIPGTLI